MDNVLLNEACSSGCGSFIENFAASLGYSAEDFAQGSAVRAAPGRSRHALHGVHELQRQAGAEGGRGRRRISPPALPIPSSKTRSIRSSSSPTRASLARTSSCRAAPSTTRPCCARSRGSPAREVTSSRHFGHSWARSARRCSPASHYHGQETAMLPLTEIRNAGATRRTTAALRRLLQPLHADGHALPRRAAATSPATAAKRRCAAVRMRTKRARDLFAYKRERLFRYPPLAAESCAARWARHPACAEYVRELPLLGDVFQGPRLPRDPLAALRPQALRAAAWSPFRPSPSAIPPKLAHGHVQWLIDEGVHTIFHPCVFFEHQETPDAQNHFNCPIVVSYPENLKNNVEAAADGEVRVSQALPCLHEREDGRRPPGALLPRAVWNIPEKETRAGAFHLAWAEQQRAKEDVRAEGARVLAKMRAEADGCGVVLAGRPYHR